MKYTQLQSLIKQSIYGSELKAEARCYGNHIVETVNGCVFVNGKSSEYSSLEEARQQIKQQIINEDLYKKIQKQLYEEVSDNQIANIIRCHHKDVRVTDTLIESYVELASSKLFTTDPVAQEIRSFNYLDKLVEGRLDYILDDGSVVVITEATQQRINNVFGQHPDVVAYMRESKENFLDVLNQLEE